MRLHFIFFYINCFSVFSQIGPNSPKCEATFYNDFYQFNLKDSIEFHIECWSKIDLSNETCNFIIGENCYNIVPQESSKILCVIYFENTLAINELDLMSLFDDPIIRSKYINRIQTVFIYDQTTGFNDFFDEKETILQLLSLDIRAGFLNPNK